MAKLCHDELCSTLDHHLLCIDMIGCFCLVIIIFFFDISFSIRLLTIGTVMFNELGIEKGLILYYCKTGRFRTKQAKEKDEESFLLC